MRRTNARGRRVDSRQTPLSIIKGTTPYAWLRADLYAVDGGTSKVGSFADAMNSARSWATAVSADQVAVPAASSAFGGQLVATLSDAMYIWSGAAANFNFMHLGAGCDVYVVASADSVAAGTQYLVATSGAAGAGHQLARTTTAFSNVLYTDAHAVISNRAATAMVAGTGHVLRMSYLEGRSNEAQLRVSTGSLDQGDTTGAPGTGDASTACKVGCRLTKNSPWVGKVASILFYDRVLTTSEDTQLRDAIQRHYGVT